MRDGQTLANAYSLIVFSGHHEYVTTHEYDVVTQYRNLGGNLAFLAANNFFWKITIKNHVMTRVAQWRDLGRPEAALIGVQYRGNDRGGHRGPWILRSGAAATPWLFAGLNLEPGQGICERRHRDRRHLERFAQGHPHPGGDPEPLRPRLHGADDLLRDAGRREGVRGGRVLARGATSGSPRSRR